MQRGRPWCIIQGRSSGGCEFKNEGSNGSFIEPLNMEFVIPL
jgi:hypothetical protein